MSNIIKGVGAPGKIRASGTIYEDKKSGILYVQNKSPFGNDWTPLDTNYLDDGNVANTTFTGGTVAGATNFNSTISSGGTNLYSIFSRIEHTHPISDVQNLEGELNQKAPLDSPTFIGNMTLIKDVGEENGNFEIGGNLTAQSIYATTKLATKEFSVAVENISESSYSIKDGDYCLFIESTTTVTLPASPYPGRVLVFKMTSTGGRTLTIQGNGNVIDGNTSTALNTARASLTMIFNVNTDEWMIIS